MEIFHGYISLYEPYASIHIILEKHILNISIHTQEILGTCRVQCPHVFFVWLVDVFPCVVHPGDYGHLQHHRWGVWINPKVVGFRRGGTVRPRSFCDKKDQALPGTPNNHFLMDGNGDFQPFPKSKGLESSNCNNHLFRVPGENLKKTPKDIFQPSSFHLFFFFECWCIYIELEIQPF